MDTLTPEQVAEILNSAKAQGEVNTVLLSVIAVLILLIVWGARRFATKFYEEFQEGLKEIRDIKIDVARHDEAIEILQEHSRHKR